MIASKHSELEYATKMYHCIMLATVLQLLARMLLRSHDSCGEYCGDPGRVHINKDRNRNQAYYQKNPHADQWVHAMTTVCKLHAARSAAHNALR